MTADDPAAVQQDPAAVGHGPIPVLPELADRFTAAFPALVRARFEQHLGPMPDGKWEQLAHAIDTLNCVLLNCVVGPVLAAPDTTRSTRPADRPDVPRPVPRGDR